MLCWLIIDSSDITQNITQFLTLLINCCSWTVLNLWSDFVLENITINADLRTEDKKINLVEKMQKTNIYYATNLPVSVLLQETHGLCFAFDNVALQTQYPNVTQIMTEMTALCTHLHIDSRAMWFAPLPSTSHWQTSKFSARRYLGPHCFVWAHRHCLCLVHYVSSQLF